jgi:Flp pilus assembly protein TadG
VKRHRLLRHDDQRGVVAVELGLVMMIFVTLLLAVTGLAQLLWVWNASVQATRLGARLASVCDQNDPIIKQRMREQVEVLRDDNTHIDYFKPGSSAPCVADDAVNACRMVRVTISGYSYPLAMGLVSLSVPLPEFRTTQPREVMRSSGNTICH